jgi:xylan 1,4-beta-xylosidase
MFGLMGGQRLALESSGATDLEAIRNVGVRGRPDVGALASQQNGKVCVMIWHHHDDDVPGPAALVELSLTQLVVPSGPTLVQHFRIDGDHSNAFETWKRMGSPQRPTSGQYAELERASNLAILTSPEWMRPKGGKLTLKFNLPRQAVSLLVLDCAAKSN